MKAKRSIEIFCQLTSSFIFVSLIFFPGLTDPVSAAVVNDPLKLALGARAIGLGRSCLASTDDINALFINPAGLAALGNFQASVMAGNFADDFSYASIGLGIPTPWTTLAVGFAKSEAGGIIRTTYADGRVIPDPSGEVFGASDNVFLVGVANKISFWGLDWQVGGRFKVYQQFLAQYSRLGFGLDVGTIIKPMPDLDLALSLQNILPPRLRWAHLDQQTQTIYPLLSLGAAYHLWQNKVTISGQIDQTLPKGPLQTHLGLEWWLSPELSIRLGSDDNFGNLTLGVGLWTGGVAGQSYPSQQDWEFDYAFQRMPVDIFPMGGHYFSLAYLGQSGLAKLPPGAPTPLPGPSPEPSALSRPSTSDQPAQIESKSSFYDQTQPEPSTPNTTFYGEEATPTDGTQPSAKPATKTNKQAIPVSEITGQPLKVTTTPAQEMK